MYQRPGAVMCAGANHCRLLPAPPSDRPAESLLMWRLPRGSSASNRLKIFTIDSNGPLTCNRATLFVVNHSELLYSSTTFQILRIVSEYLRNHFIEKWQIREIYLYFIKKSDRNFSYFFYRVKYQSGLLVIRKTILGLLNFKMFGILTSVLGH